MGDNLKRIALNKKTAFTEHQQNVEIVFTIGVKEQRIPSPCSRKSCLFKNKICKE
jgi:hypothetical protein